MPAELPYAFAQLADLQRGLREYLPAGTLRRPHPHPEHWFGTAWAARRRDGRGQLSVGSPRPERFADCAALSKRRLHSVCPELEQIRTTAPCLTGLLASKPRDCTLKREQNSCYEHDNGLTKKPEAVHRRLVQTRAKARAFAAQTDLAVVNSFVGSQTGWTKARPFTP
jgi:hypothetical protein